MTEKDKQIQVLAELCTELSIRACPDHGDCRNEFSCVHYGKVGCLKRYPNEEAFINYALEKANCGGVTCTVDYYIERIDTILRMLCDVIIKEKAKKA